MRYLNFSSSSIRPVPLPPVTPQNRLERIHNVQHKKARPMQWKSTYERWTSNLAIHTDDWWQLCSWMTRGKRWRNRVRFARVNFWQTRDYFPSKCLPASITPIKSAQTTPPVLAAATVLAAHWVNCARWHRNRWRWCAPGRNARCRSRATAPSRPGGRRSRPAVQSDPRPCQFPSVSAGALSPASQM